MKVQEYYAWKQFKCIEKRCDLFLMSGGPEIKISDQNHLYLYKGDKGQFYYKIKDNDEEQYLKLSDEVTKEVLKEAELNREVTPLNKCSDEQICEAVFAETSKKGHTSEARTVAVISENLLFSLIERNVKSFFAIVINNDFKNFFKKMAEIIQIYMLLKYGEKWTSLHYNMNDDLEEALFKLNNHKTSVYLSNPLALKHFILYLNDHLSISVYQTLDICDEKKLHHLNIEFPNEISKKNLESLLGGRTPFQKDQYLSQTLCPSYDSKNPLVLKFPLLLESEQKKVCGVFPNLNMSKRLFEILPTLAAYLEVQDNKFAQAQKDFGFIVQFNKVINDHTNKFKIYTPDSLFGITRVFLSDVFPKSFSDGELYVKLNGSFNNILMRMRDTKKPKRLDARGIKKLMASLDFDNIKNDINTLKDEFLEIPQNYLTFLTLALAFGVCYSKFNFPSMPVADDYYIAHQAEINNNIQISLTKQEEIDANAGYKLAVCIYNRAMRNEENELEDAKKNMNFMKLHYEITCNRFKELNEQKSILETNTDSAFSTLIKTLSLMKQSNPSKDEKQQTSPRISSV